MVERTCVSSRPLVHGIRRKEGNSRRKQEVNNPEVKKDKKRTETEER